LAVPGLVARSEAKEFTPPEIHRLIGDWSEDGVRKALRRLVDTGVVDAERKGNAYLYRLNRRHLAADAIVELAGLRHSFIRRLQDTLGAWAEPPAHAVLFGSAARREMSVDSDIDVFVVRPADATDDVTWRAQLYALQEQASAWTGNDVRILEYSESDVETGLASGDPVLADIGRDGIWLAGRSTLRMV
jgi:predicted nucleotidyltransferase